MNRRMCYVQFSWPSLYWLTRRSERGSNAQHTPLTLKQQVQMMIRKSSSTFSMKSDTQFVWISICHTLIKNMYISFYRCSNGHNVSLCLSLEADDLSWVFVCAYSEHFLSTPLTMSEAYTTSEQVCDRSMYCLLHIFTPPPPSLIICRVFIIWANNNKYIFRWISLFLRT